MLSNVLHQNLRTRFDDIEREHRSLIERALANAEDRFKHSATTTATTVTPAAAPAADADADDKDYSDMPALCSESDSEYSVESD